MNMGMLAAAIPTAIVFLAGFAATFAVNPPLISKLKKRGFVGRDMNKRGERQAAEMGGISVVIGFAFASMVAIGFFSYLGAFKGLEMTLLLAGLLTITLVAMIGIIDDLVGWRQGIRQWQHALFPIFAALPLMAVNAGQSNIALPVMGLVNMGIIYSLVFIPIGITGASNAANMVAGMNGLEAGMGIINTIAMLIAAWFLGGRIEVIVIGVALLAALLAFLWFNRFPARIFPGDSLTLMVGASIAVMAIIGDMERVGILLFAIYFIELAIKARHRFQSQCFGIPQDDGTIAPNPKGGSITHWVMARGRLRETQVVGIILAMQTVVASAVLFLVFNKLL